MCWRKRIQHLRIFGGKISEFRRESVWKKFLRLYILQKNVIRIIYWLWERKFQTFSKSSQQSCQNGILRIQRLSSGKKFSEVYSSLIFSDTAQNFWTLCDEFFAGLSIMHFTHPKGVFWEKFLFEICAWHSRISSDNRCGFMAENFSVELSNLNPKCPDHPFSEKNLLEYLSISLFLDCEQ